MQIKVLDSETESNELNLEKLPKLLINEKFNNLNSNSTIFSLPKITNSVNFFN